MIRCSLQSVLCIYSLEGFRTAPCRDLGIVGLQYLYYYYIYEHICDVMDHTGMINFCESSNETKKKRKEKFNAFSYFTCTRTIF